ncbi:MAG: putative glycoside hydrolase [Oscillospiraceae bacterium]|nr:putative glycoside hydrolase [Oscillospiraceae bacterium]
MDRRGRKIYRTRAGNRKRRAQNFFKVLFMLIILAALVFVGYSVAKPVYKYFSERSDKDSSEETVPWTPPVMPDDTDSMGETTDVPDETSGAADDTAADGNKMDFSAYQLPETALISESDLKAALENAKGSGYTAVVVTLKAEGGKIYYKTNSQMALSAEDAVVGNMYAGQIAGMIKNAGFTPIAKINLLEDHNWYGEYKTGAYRFEGSTSTWLDDSAANGGKPWLSPFDTDTQSYAAYLANEISGSSFDCIIFDGIVFPNFRSSDLNYVGAIVKDPEKYKTLISITDIAAKAAEANGASVMATVSAGEIIGGKSDLFKPAELTVKTVSVEYFPSELENTALINGEEIALSELTAYDKATVVFGEIKRLAGEDMTIVPAVRQTDFSQADFSETISAFMDLGFSSYIILG